MLKLPKQPTELVAHDVLMALADEVRAAIIAEVTRDNIISVTGDIIKRAKKTDISIIVERYVTQFPAVDKANKQQEDTVC